VIEARRYQLNLAEGLIAEEVEELWEPWMRHVDEVLVDEALLETVYEALAQRHPHSRTRGRRGTPAEVVLRMLLLKHIRNWSFAALEREVRANLVYRQFTRVGSGKVPDAKTLGRIARALGPEIIEQLHQRVVAIAHGHRIVQGRKLRVDTTVVETDIHHPTDSGLLGDGVRVLTRAMKAITQIAGEVGTKLRDRSRSVKFRLIEIGRASRSRQAQSQEKMKQGYEKLLSATARVVGQAKRFAREVAEGIKRASTEQEQSRLQAHARYLETMIPRVKQVMRQTRERLFRGNPHAEGKLVSLFEPHTEIIRKGKAGKPTEFGKMVKVQEAEGQIFTHYEVYDERPADSELLVPAIETHQRQFGRVPRLVSADAGFYSADNEAQAHGMGVTRVSIPNRSTKSAERKKHQKQRWFRDGQKWRAGSEGRISVIKRRHGLDRSRYKGAAGIKRWVGLGVLADNLLHIGHALASAHTEAD
jgi:IS5 family transposase